MERRELIQILAAVPVLAQSSSTPQAYTPRFFTKAEHAELDQLTEALIPSEPGSPGARAANVTYYLDTVLHYADPSAQAMWRDGLSAIRKLNVPPTQAVATLAEKETAPRTSAETFFVAMKRLTIEAFCHAEIAQRDFFGYKGNHAIHHFPGCGQ